MNRVHGRIYTDPVRERYLRFNYVKFLWATSMAYNAIIAIGATLIIGFGALLAVTLFVLLVMRGREPPLKRVRYEAGNLPSGKARSWLPIQYYGYLILFLAFEPILMLLYLIPYYVRINPLSSFLMLVAVLLIAIPPLIYGLKQAGKIEKWKLR